jgi:hypothetical protein
VPSFFNWVTQVGFEIEGIALVVLAGVALAAKAGVSAGVGLKAALLIGAVLIQACLPLIGHAAMLRALRWLAFPFIVLFVIMAIITAGKVKGCTGLRTLERKPGQTTCGRRWTYSRPSASTTGSGPWKTRT